MDEEQRKAAELYDRIIESNSLRNMDRKDAERLCDLIIESSLKNMKQKKASERLYNIGEGLLGLAEAAILFPLVIGESILDPYLDGIKTKSIWPRTRKERRKFYRDQLFYAIELYRKHVNELKNGKHYGWEGYRPLTDEEKGIAFRRASRVGEKVDILLKRLDNLLLKIN